MSADLTSVEVQGLLTSWLTAAKAKLSQPDKIGPKELNRLGELLLAVMAAQAEREAKLALAARRAAIHAAAGGSRV